MEKTYRILFSDDDKRYSESLVDRAFSDYKLELDHFEDWEEAYSRLFNDLSYYDAVIIDGKGKLTTDSSGDDQKHVSQAIGDLRELKGRGHYIPYVVLSKYLEIKDTIPERFFEKGRDEEEMFQHLIKEIESADDNKLKVKYQDAFNSFGDKYLNQEAENNMLEAVRAFETSNWSASNFAALRKVIEAVYKDIHLKDDALIPYKCLRYDDNKINFTLCERRLKGQTINDMNTGRITYPAVEAVLPGFLASTITPFTMLCNKSLHIDYKDRLTKNTLGACIYFIIDLLVWYKQFVDQNYYKPRSLTKMHQ